MCSGLKKELMKKKKVMLLGAGAFQLPAIKKAQNANYEVIVVSNNPNDPGMQIADKSITCSTLEKEKLAEIGRKENIDGVFTIASEIAAPSVAYISDKLNLSGYKYETAQIISNKYKLRSYLEQQDLNGIKFGTASNLGEAYKVFEQLSKPIMLKPSSASGSRSVYKIYNKSELESYFSDSLKSSFLEKTVIMEEFLTGREVGGEALIIDGKIKFLAITKKYVTKEFVPYGHLLPCDIRINARSNIKALLQSTIDHFNIISGPLNFDIMLNGDVPKIIELGGRLGGNCLPLLMKQHTKTDTIKAVIELSLGNDITHLIKNEISPVAAYILHSNEDGILKNNIEQTIKNSEFVNSIIDYKILYSPGDTIKKFNSGSNQLGYIIFAASSQNELIKLFDKIESKKWIELT